MTESTCDVFAKVTCRPQRGCLREKTFQDVVVDVVVDPLRSLGLVDDTLHGTEPGP